MRSTINNALIPLHQVGSFLFLIVAVASLGLVEWVVLVFGIPIPWFGYRLPYLGPIAMLVTFFALCLVARNRNAKVCINLEAIFFMFAIAIMVLRKIHECFVAGPGASIGYELDVLWLSIMLMAFILLEQAFRKNLTINVNYTLSIILIWVLLSLFLQFLSGGRGISRFGITVDGQLWDTFSINYASCFGLALVYCLSNRLDSRAPVHNLFVCTVVVIFIFHIISQRLTGPLIAAGVISSLKCLALIYEKSNVRSYLVQGLLTILVCMVGIYVCFPGLHSVFSGIHNSWQFADQLEDLGDVSSWYVRYFTIVESLRLFLESPVFGVGSDVGSAALVFHHSVHSLFFLILSSNGLSVTLPLAIAFCIMTTKSFSRRGIEGLIFPSLILICALLHRDIFLWTALLIYFMIQHVKTQAPR